LAIPNRKVIGFAVPALDPVSRVESHAMKPIPSKKSRRAEPLSIVNPRAAGKDIGMHRAASFDATRISAPDAV
jgi:hypothetical protein